MQHTPEELQAMAIRLRKLGQKYRDQINPRTDYHGQDLRGRSFAGEDLSDIVFNEANLSHVSFQGARIGYSTWSQSVLHQADFRQARIAKSDFFHADLTGATFEQAHLLRIIFNGGNLANTWFAEATCESVSFRETRLQGSSFRAAILDRTTFGEASLAQVDFTGARFDDVYMAGAHDLDQVQADWILVGDAVFFERLEGAAAQEYLHQIAQYATAAAVRWREAGQDWRYAPELRMRHQAALASLRAQRPEMPFAGMTLTRAAIEWLVATTPEPTPVDLRGAQLAGVELAGLPDARLWTK